MRKLQKFRLNAEQMEKGARKKIEEKYFFNKSWKKLDGKIF